MEQSADKAQSGPQAEAPNEANPKSGVDPDPWAVSEESKTGKPWGEDSKEIQADPQAKSWDSLEFGYDRGARVARGGYPRGDRGNFRSSDRGPSRNRGPRGRGRGNFKFHKEKNSDENAQYEPRGPHERGGRNRGSWKSGEHQEWKPKYQREEQKDANQQEEQKGGSWENLEFSKRKPKYQNKEYKKPSNEYKPKEQSERPPKEEGEEDKTQSPTREYRKKRGVKRGGFEKAKVRRHRFIANQHNTEVLYRDEDEEAFDPETHTDATHFRANRDWKDLPIPDYLLKAIEDAKFSYPSKIQNFGIEVILKDDNENLLAQAPNGSGKTATFVIGSLCRIDRNNPGTQVICINPTLELANQNYEVYKKFADPAQITVAVLAKGGESAVGQVLVVSSGSFFKALKSGSLNLQTLKVLIFDEADHLLNQQDNIETFKLIEKFIKELPPNQVQILMFSATFSDEIRNDIVKLLVNLNEITIKKEDLMLDTIDHFYYRVNQNEKIDKFGEVLTKIQGAGVTIAFVNTCNFARTVYNVVSRSGHASALLMGQNMTFEERNLTMKDFNEGNYACLVTTNLLARGIDNTLVKCVINFDLPRIRGSKVIDDVLYLHRTGRCSRFGRHGVTINLVTTDEELATLKLLEETYNFEINEISKDELERILTVSNPKDAEPEEV